MSLESRVDPVPELFIKPTLMLSIFHAGDEDTIVAVEFKLKIFIDLVGAGITVDPAYRLEARFFCIWITFQVSYE